MKEILIFSPKAKDEFKDAIKWYEGTRNGIRRIS